MSFMYLADLVQIREKIVANEAKLNAAENVGDTCDYAKFLAEQRKEENIVLAAAAGLLEVASVASTTTSQNGIRTPANQSTASTFGSSNPILGFGWLPISFHIDPTEDRRVHKALVPTEAEKSAFTLGIPFMGEVPALLPRGEAAAENNLRAILWGDAYGLRYNYNESLGQLNLSLGIATPASYPEFIWRTANGIVLGVVELKSGDACSFAALRHAATMASNIAMGLLNQGVPPSSCIVPTVVTNGNTMQFGAVFMLEPSFPVFVCTSGVLDLNIFSGERLACSYLKKAQRWTKALVAAYKLDERVSVTSPSLTITSMVLDDVEKYHIKELTERAIDNGLGLFRGDIISNQDIGPGLRHMGRALDLLYAVPELRKHVVFPQAVISPGFDGGGGRWKADSFCIVYENLSKKAGGYRIGTPDRISNPALYDRFIAELSRIIGMVHEAGVIHCDLYASNFMWALLPHEKEESPSSSSGSASASTAHATTTEAVVSTHEDSMAAVDGGAATTAITTAGNAGGDSVRDDDDDGGRVLDVRIIDWDCAHCLCEGQFNSAIEEALSDHKPTRGSTLGKQHDLKYINALKREVRQGDDQVWKALASNNKVDVDCAFFKLLADEAGKEYDELQQQWQKRRDEEAEAALKRRRMK